MEKEEEYVYISNQGDLENLIKRISNLEMFAHPFIFNNKEYFIKLLKSLSIDYENFITHNFYCSKNYDLHISESNSGYVWISTFGLIAKDKLTTNKAVNACTTQFTVLSLIIKKAIDISESKDTYDVNSFKFENLSELSPALFQNIIFYIEVFCKAYLSLCGDESIKTHKLSLVYSNLLDKMYNEKHNDSLFHVQIINEFFKIVDYVTTIPNFKEHFVKYDDNPDDKTVIIFNPKHLKEMNQMLEYSYDFIIEFYYLGNKSFYINNGVYNRLLKRAKNEEQKEKIIKMYSYLINKK